VLPFVLVALLFGIPAAGSVALILALQISQFLYGQANLFLFPVEVGSLVAVAGMVFALRWLLAQPSSPEGFYRHILDFLAMSRWHLAVKFALIVLLVVPPAWYIHGEYWRFILFRLDGWKALQRSDVQSGLDGIIAIWQLSLTGGVPLLFALHMLSRWKPKRRWLPWVLVPFLFVGTAFGVVILVAIGHS
jgi:hypothetical protein